MKYCKGLRATRCADTQLPQCDHELCDVLVAKRQQPSGNVFPLKLPHLNWPHLSWLLLFILHPPCRVCGNCLLWHLIKWADDIAAHRTIVANPIFVIEMLAFQLPVLLEKKGLGVQ